MPCIFPLMPLLSQSPSFPHAPLKRSHTSSIIQFACVCPTALPTVRRIFGAFSTRHYQEKLLNFTPKQALGQDTSHMANQLKREKDWSPLCEACLSRTKSVKFRVAILDRAKPLKYDVRTDELVSGCVVCSLVVRQLNYRKPISASEFSVAGVSILGAGPSNIHLSVNNSYSLNLYLFTRPGGNIVISSCRDYPNLP